MDITGFIDYLNKTRGWTIQGSYYSNIATWRSWYEGYVPSFHEYSEMGLDKKRHKRKLFRLQMAKKISEDWASLLLNDKTKLKVGDSAAATWLYGSDDQTGGQMARLQFWGHANALVEDCMRSGTGAFVMSVENMLTDGGQVIPSTGAQIQLDYLPAECILPLTVEHGRVTECAFATEKTRSGKSCVYLQTHTKNADGTYRIENAYYEAPDETAYDQTAYKPLPLPAGTAAVVNTGSSIPWFAVFTPGIRKNLHGGPGLGQAVYATALDQLMHVDTAFNNYHRDLTLGGKKLFYSKRLIETTIDSEGVEHQVAPDDVQQQLFWSDDLTDEDAKAEVYDYNPSLRADENSKAVQDALDYLSFVVGFGTHHYVFNASGGHIQTATQYNGDRQDLVQNANRHATRIETALIQIVRAMLWAARYICGVNLDPDTEIGVVWDDSYITDAESRRQNCRADVLQGILPKYRYLMEYYGMSQEEAQEAVKQAQDEQAPTASNIFPSFE